MQQRVDHCRICAEVWDAAAKKRLTAWKLLAVQADEAPDWPLPAAKVFTPKYKLPAISDYREPAPAVGMSMVSEQKLREVYEEAGLVASQALEEVCNDIRHGADIGCKGEFRKPSRSGNAPSAFDVGAQVTDSIASWLDKGFVVGPIDKDDLPPDIKINGIMCREKPNGSARVIMNFSAPKGRSVNEGIDKKEFPATMSSTGKWIAILEKAGRGAWMAKCDWSEAYKHLAVRPEDIRLQYFQWLGKYFAEICLVFGAVSSAGLYDRLAKVVLVVVIALAGFSAEMVCQYLDDTCAAAPAGRKAELEKFYQTYSTVARRVGVLLADTADPDKAFAPCTKGVVLGVEYDTVAWTWRIPREKAARFIQQLRTLIASDSMRQDDIWRIVGRVVHYAPLIPDGKFNIDCFMLANKHSDERDAQVPITDKLRRQAGFWILMMKLCSGTSGIPDLSAGFPAWTTEVFTDAAGGSLNGIGRGCGGVAGNWWFYLPWSRKVNCGVKAADGKKLSKKLSALELVGPLVAVSAAAQFGLGDPMRIWVDNFGSVRIWKKGYSSSCALCNTLVKAMATVAAAFGCRVTLEKIRRCSTKPAILADLLSKADFRRFWALRSQECNRDPSAIPKSILAWVANPVPDEHLGTRILRDLGMR